MLVKIDAQVPIFPGTDFHFPSTSVPPGTFLGSGCIGGYTPYTNLGVFLTAYTHLSDHK